LSTFRLPADIQTGRYFAITFYFVDTVFLTDWSVIDFRWILESSDNSLIDGEVNDTPLVINHAGIANQNHLVD
jgi:hypothetical protein